MTNDAKRASARRKGLQVAARVAGLGGLAIAVVGIAEARASELPGRGAPTAQAADGPRTLPAEGWLQQARGGNCGCSPCWGPPSPPRKTARRARAAAQRGTSRSAAKRGAT